MAQSRHKKLLVKRSRKGLKGHPIATIAYYGPDNTRASKVVCCIIRSEGAEAEPMQKWFTEFDARKSEKILSELISFIEENNAKTVTMIDQIIGCPHEEGIDYPNGESCSDCPFWKNRDRLTHELEN
jgi:hypothetical protein